MQILQQAMFWWLVDLKLSWQSSSEKHNTWKKFSAAACANTPWCQTIWSVYCNTAYTDKKNKLQTLMSTQCRKLRSKLREFNFVIARIPQLRLAYCIFYRLPLTLIIRCSLAVLMTTFWISFAIGIQTGRYIYIPCAINHDILILLLSSRGTIL